MAILYRTMKDNFDFFCSDIYFCGVFRTNSMYHLSLFLSHSFDTVSPVAKVSLLPLMLFPPYSTEAEKERIACLFSRSVYGELTVAHTHKAFSLWHKKGLLGHIEYFRDPEYRGGHILHSGMFKR